MINGMQAAGVIERYAIGGAVAATFYLEPVATLDVDVFVEFHTEPGSQMISRSPFSDICVIVVARWKENISSLLAGRSSSYRRAALLCRKRWRRLSKKMWKARLLSSLPQSTSPQSRSKRAGQKIKRACFNSSRLMQSIWAGCKKSLRVMVWLAL